MDTPDSPMMSLPDHVAEVLKAAPKPLAMSALKTKLKAAGVPMTGKGKIGDADIQAAVDAHVGEGKAFVHPTKSEDKPTYWHTAYVSKTDKAAEKAAEKERAAAAKLKATQKAKSDKVSAALRAKVSALGNKLVSEKQLGQPKATAMPAEQEAFKTTLAALLDEHKLHRYGEKFGTSPPVVTHWYETGPLKKTFGDAVKALQKLLDSGKVEFEGLAALFKEKLGAKSSDHEVVEPTAPTTPTVQPPVAPEVKPPPAAHHYLRTELKKAYDHLCRFAEFKHGRVEIRRIYHQVKQSMPGLEVADFHKELLDLSRGRVLELHVLNEVKEAQERELAIERNERLLYYVIWD